MADSQKYGRTANLFNYAEVTWVSGIKDANGNITSSTQSHFTDNYTEVKSNTEYSIDGFLATGVETKARIYFYDGSHNWISRTELMYEYPTIITTPANCKYVQFQCPNEVNGSSIMFVEGAYTSQTMPSYQPYLDWQHSLRKLTTATEAVENPLYSDGTAITAYSIKGNTTQSGTPTPSNPVDVNGVGVRTENLFDGTLLVGFYLDINTMYTDNPNYRSFRIQGLPAGQYTVSWNIPVRLVRVYYDGVMYENAGEDLTSYTVTSSDGDIAFSFRDETSPDTPWSNSNTVMLNTGSTAKPFEPYGYKIPISSGGVTTNIYLGSTQTVRQIKKLVLDGSETWYINNAGTVNAFFSMVLANPLNVNLGISTHFIFKGIYTSNDDVGFYVTTTGELRIRPDNVSSMTKSDFTTWLSQQYANSTPVCVWYVLATPTTGIVNEPLMKIGTYADTLSNAASIPTTEGANSITVDTTVQPSEFTATWSGWHNASVKEYDSNYSIAMMQALTIAQLQTHTISELQGGWS